MSDRGVNQVHILGNLGSDAEKIQTQKNFGCRFSVAVNYRYKGNDGDWREEATWIPCSYWNAANVFEYLTKGRRVAIYGRLRNFRYTTQDGREQRGMDLLVDTLLLLGERRTTEQNGTQQQYSDADENAPDWIDEPEPEKPAEKRSTSKAPPKTAQKRATAQRGTGRR